jgi:hypothetical protein
VHAINQGCTQGGGCSSAAPLNRKKEEEEEEKKKDFEDTMIKNALHDLPYSRNQRLKSSDDLH